MRISFYTSSVFLIALFQVYGTSPITVNGVELKKLIEPDEVLMYEWEEATPIIIRVKEGALEIGAIELKTSQQEITDYFNNLKAHQHQLSQYNSGKTCSMHCSKNMDMCGAYLAAGEVIKLSARHAINLSTAILQSPEIYFSCSKLAMASCLIHAKSLKITSACPDSLFKAIGIFFKEDQFLACIQGIFDFARNETETDFIIIGAYTVGIKFAPEAFE